MKSQHTPYSVLKRRSIFYKTLALLTALSIITMLIFVTFINNLIVRNQKKSIDELSLFQLQRIGSDVELVFDLLANNMVSSMGSRDFISAMITPTLLDTDTAYRIVRALGDLVEENALVRKAYLYLPYTDEVYVYSGTYMNLEHLGDRDLIYRYLKSRAGDRNPESLSEWNVMLHNRRIFLAADYCIPNFIGALFIEINRVELYNIIQAENQKFDTTIYVYDQRGQLLFDYMAAGLQQSDFENDALFMRADSDDNHNASYYIHTSDLLGWKFITRTNHQNANIPPSKLLGLLLPVLLFYILVSQLFSLYITQSVYKPINRLIRITTVPDAAQPPSEEHDSPRKIRNEADYLELAFLNSIEKNEQHKALMHNIAGDIIEQTLRGIISGKNINAQQIKATLEGIGHERLGQGRYMVLAGLLSYPENQRPDMVELELFQRSVVRIFRSAAAEDYRILTFFPDKDIAASVLFFAQNAALIQIKEWVCRLEEAVLRAVEPLPFGLVIGRGHVYNDIASLQFSYHEAVDHVRYAQYIGDSARDNAEAVESGEGMYESLYYIRRAKKLINAMESVGMAETEAEIVALIKEMYGREVVSKEGIHRMLDDVTELLIAARVTLEEMRSAGISRDLEHLLMESDPEHQQESMVQFYRSALNLLQTARRRSHNKYAVEAKEYVALHYMDGELSLGKISEALGISLPYLSAIFTETTGEKLSSYLNHYRIRQARRFLSETNLNISEIGYKCGFNSAQSFGRVFKKTVGITPKQYRENTGI